MKRATRGEWTERVSRWETSGQTAREFAAAEGWKAATLLWWSAELRRAERQRVGKIEFIEIAPQPPSTKVSERTVEEGRIEVVVGEQVRIRVSGAFDASVLRRVVEALEAR